MKVWPPQLVLVSLLAATPAFGQEPVETFRTAGANPASASKPWPFPAKRSTRSTTS